MPHQVEGARWLAERRRGLLADEPRVGKTPTAIRACDLVGVTSVLVLCPSIARQNWLREFWRFSSRKGSVVASRKDVADDFLTICSYDLVIDKAVYAQLARPWGAVILDEAHFLKSDNAKRADASWKIAAAARYCWALTGTPAPNHAAELYQLLVNFGVVGCSYYQFVEFYCQTTAEGKIVGNKNVEALKALLAPVTLRRKLAEVAPGMPPIQWSTVVVEPGPVAFDGTAGYARREEAALRERLEQAQAEIDQLDPRDSLWFRRLCGLQKVQPTVEILRDEFACGLGQIVVFAWHRDVLAAIAAAFGDDAAVLDGGTSDRDRNHIIDQFAARKLRMVCAQVYAAGTAIDLSAADDVLFVEQDWTPANNAQAVMRVMSQFKKRPVRARALAIAGSIDEAVQSSLLRKTRMVNELFT